MVAILARCRRHSRLVCWYARQRLTLTLGVLTGIISSCGSIERLTRDHILPPFFLRRIKYTKAPYISIIIFTIIGLAMFAVVNTNLTILSGQFAISFILVMGLFALSNIFLKFNRDRLVRDPHVSLGLVLFALCVVSAAVTGEYCQISCYCWIFRSVFCRCICCDDLYWISGTIGDDVVLDL